MERDEVAHLTADGWDADLEPALAAPVAMPGADHDRAASPGDAADAVGRAQVVDVKVEGSRVHRPLSVMGRVAVSRIVAVIALAAGLALLIGWYRGFNLRSLELAAATFAVVLAVQTVGLIVTGGDTGPHYWPIIGLVAAGWVACLWIGSRMRPLLGRRRHSS